MIVWEEHPRGHVSQVQCGIAKKPNRIRDKVVVGEGRKADVNEGEYQTNEHTCLTLPSECVSLSEPV
jgi:hypothetical protein